MIRLASVGTVAVCAAFVLCASSGRAIGFWDATYDGSLTAIQKDYQNRVFTSISVVTSNKTLTLAQDGTAVWNNLNGVWQEEPAFQEASAKFDHAFRDAVQALHPAGTIKKAKSRLNPLNKFSPSSAIYAESSDVAKLKDGGFALKLVTTGVFTGTF